MRLRQRPRMLRGSSPSNRAARPAAKWQPNARYRAKAHKDVISRRHEKFNQILNPRKITSLEPTQSGLFKMTRLGILKTSQRPRNIGNVLPLASSGKRSRARTLKREYQDVDRSFFADCSQGCSVLAPKDADDLEESTWPLFLEASGTD
jgi:hypothetical protein